MGKYKVGDRIVLRGTIMDVDRDLDVYDISIDGQDGEGPFWVDRRALSDDHKFRDQAAIAAMQEILGLGMVFRGGLELEDQLIKYMEASAISFDLAEIFDAERKRRNGEVGSCKKKKKSKP